jgi:hypothetical protein
MSGNYFLTRTITVAKRGYPVQNVNRLHSAASVCCGRLRMSSTCIAEFVFVQNAGFDG